MKASKPRGMAAAHERARQIFSRGGGIKDCPYRARSWRTAFAAEMQKLQQKKLIED